MHIAQVILGFSRWKLMSFTISPLLK